MARNSPQAKSMEISLNPMKNPQTTSKRGGLRTMPFIIANETFEKVASIGLHANMMMYLRMEYHLDVATGVSILFLWGAMSNFTPIIGAIVSDSYLGRFRVIALGTVTTLLGMGLLLLTATIPHARPPHCSRKDVEHCAPSTLPQLVLLLSSFALMSLGAGGIRPCSMAFGADQLHGCSGNNGRLIQSFFNWYYASIAIAVMVSVTVIVYIQDKLGWVVGFGVPLGLMFFSTVMFFVGSSLYVNVKANKSLFPGFAHVVSAAWKNRHLPGSPPESFDGWYYLKGSKLVRPTDKLRFLNKACVIRNPDKDLTPEGLASDPWSLSTVKQVEELKSLLRVFPIWSTGIFIAASLGQHSVSLIQANTTDRHVTAHGRFQIPAGSFVLFSILTLILWVAVYDRAVVPLLTKHTKRRRGLTFKQRMGIGLAISCLATAVAALVESKRRREHFNGKTMSAFWLVPQYSLTGLAEAFNAIGQIEFYYSQFPKSMASIAVAMFFLGMGFGNLVGAVVLKAVNDVSERSTGRLKWVSNDPNKGHYDYYYWVLTLLGLVNLLYYLLCSWAYGCCEERKLWEDKDTIEGEVLEGDLEKDKEANKKEGIDDHLDKSKESSSPIVFAT